MIQEAKDLIKRVLYETAEDLEVLVDILKKEGIVVKRTKPLHDPLKKYNVGGFEVEFLNQPLQPRDIIGFYGNKMLEVYTKDRSSYYENWGARDILKEYFLWCRMDIRAQNELKTKT